MMKRILLILITVTITLTGYCQEDKFKALYLSNFPKSIEWPSQFMSGDFIIGVLGNSNVTQELLTVSKNKKIGNQTIVVKKFNDVSDISNCHILFIPIFKSSNLNEVLSKLKGKSTLIVTDKPGLVRSGSCVSFVLKDNKLTFEISKSNIQKQGLKVSSSLLALGIEIK